MKKVTVLKTKCDISITKKNLVDVCETIAETHDEKEYLERVVVELVKSYKKLGSFKFFSTVNDLITTTQDSLYFWNCENRS